MQARIQQLSQLVPDKRIHNYAFSTQAIIGRGAYGVVYVGRNTDSGQLVALKAVPVQSFTNDTQSLLQKEIDIMKDLDCPNIVRLIDVLTTNHNCYIVSELCTCGDLREFMKRTGFIEETSALKVLTQVLRGILQSFKRGIMHRDLKPANILIAANNTFKIADFGFAKRFDKLEEDLMTSLVGTPLYMSPQVLLRRQYTSKCDVWSIGLIYYELLEGKTPWNVRDILDLVNKQRNQKITFSKKISKVSQQFILGCLAYEESHRLGWEQIFTHPLFDNIFEKKSEHLPPSKSSTSADPLRPQKSLPIVPNLSPVEQRHNHKKLSASPINQQQQVLMPSNQLYVKTNGSPNEECNKKTFVQKPAMCMTQPNTLKKDRTISVVQYKPDSSQTTTRYSDRQLDPTRIRSKDENYKSGSKHHQPFASEPKIQFQKSLSDITDDISYNRCIIHQQVEYLNFLRKLRINLLELFGHNQGQAATIQKLSYVLLKNVMIKSNDLKSNLFDRSINCLDLRDFERFKNTEHFRSLEKQFLEVHFESFNLFQECCLNLNENLGLVIQDHEFLEIFNNNFEYSLHFSKLAQNLCIKFIKSFLYDQVLECANVKAVNFTYQMCIYASHLQALSLSVADVNNLITHCRNMKDNFSQTRVECLALIDRLMANFK